MQRIQTWPYILYNCQGKRKKRFADNLDRINFTIYDEYDYYVDDYEDELEDEWIAPPEKSQQAEDAFVRMYMQESRYSIF